ncbi:peptidylprolyl isomerase [Clostridium sp. UBA3887]|uniref:peptidylprolyl isomerase n=1 Tax=Clostridium sp. UBA3887 TaxID=1946356 RepID=UPI003216D595
MKKSTLGTLIITAILSLALIGCSTSNKTSKDETNTGSNTGSNDNKEIYLSKETEKKEGDKNPVATIEMEDGKIIKMELYPEIAPNTVRNFISLANSKFYDGLIFHRVISGFMIQGGDPEGTGMGGPDYSIYGEFTNNQFENTLLHTKGVISMARSNDKNSAGSQFFIMHGDTPSLDGDYAAFGKVIEGMDVVDSIAKVETGSNDRPKKDIKIKSISVDTFGVTYNEPVKYTK